MDFMQWLRSWQNPFPPVCCNPVTRSNPSLYKRPAVEQEEPLFLSFSIWFFKKVKFFSKTEHFFKKVKIKMKYFKKRKGIKNCQERSCWYNGGHMSAKLHQSNLSNSWLSCITWAFNALLFVAIPPKHCSSFPKELSSESSDRYHKTF